jgi:hypothetical protein
MKKRSCRMTEEEKAIHNRAVSIRKMTDAQLCEFIDRTYGKGMEEGAKLAQSQVKAKPEDAITHVRRFIDYLTEKTGSGNRIGKGTILQLNRELENAIKSGLFSGEVSK